MNDEREKSRIKETTNELASLISSLNPGSEEMLIEEYCNWHVRKLLMQSTTWLSWMDFAWGREIPLGLDLTEEPMEAKDVDDQPTPIVKFFQACEYAQ